MSKKLNIFDKVASKTNSNVLGKVEPIKGYIDIGNLAINHICSGRFYGGGIPIGSVAEFFGPSSSAKSLLGTNFLRGIQKLDGYACVADTENTINKDFVETVSYLDTSRVLWGTPSTLEDSFNFITNVVKEIKKEDQKGIIGVLFDSIAVCPCKREFEETNLPVGYTLADFKKIVKRNEQPGERAKICSKELRKINSVIKDNEATLVIINQIRDKIGVYYGNPETTAGGGRSLEFYCSIRLRTQRLKNIVDKNFKKKIIGVNIKVQSKKNKVSTPFEETDGIKLFFEAGIDPFSGLFSLLLQEKRVVEAGKGSYKVSEDFLPEGKNEYKFKASKVENIMPAEVLFECPKLVDAENTEQLVEYYSSFNSAMQGIGEYEEISTTETNEDEEIESLLESSGEEE